MLFSAVTFSPAGFITWAVIGLVAGWLAGKIMRGSGYGILGDILLGLVGAEVGGFIVGLFVTGNTGFLGSIVVAVIGACLCIYLLHLISGRRVA
jgi:uncharacterized membrane protein YeaQ/YmgE (transglycosylase-associated protein family)